MIAGPSSSGETYLAMKKRKSKTHRDLFIITRFTEQYYGFDTTNEVLDFDEYKSGVSIFDDMLDSSQKAIDPFSTRERHKDLDVYYIPQSSFDLAKRTIPKKE